MDSKIVLPESVCHDEAVDYIASRYSVTPAEIITLYMRQEGIMENRDAHRPSDCNFQLEENEMAILRDMGFRPSGIEFVNADILQK